MTDSLMDVRDDRELPFPTLRQDGPTVFRWAVWDGAEVAKKALEESGVEASDLAAFIPHQANMRIIDELAKRLGLPESVVIARDIADNGNTSAASIPLATERLARASSSAEALPCRWDSVRDSSTAPRSSASPETARSRKTLRECPKIFGGTLVETVPLRPGAPRSSLESRKEMAFTEAEVLAGLAEIVNEETGLAVEAVEPSKSFTDDLDIDSISMMTIVVNAEKKFGVKIPDDDVKDLVTVQDAVDYINKAQEA